MKSYFIFPMIATLIVAQLSGCGTTKEDEASVEENRKYTINTEYFDQSTRPQDDFFQFANGTWIEENPVPPSESRWSSFNELDKANKKKLTAILNEASDQQFEEGTSMQMIGDYYKAKSNMKLRNDKGFEPIVSLLKQIEKMKSKEEMPELIARLNKKGINAFYNFYVGQDLKGVESHVPYLSQGGLGLPNRDYYFDEVHEDIRTSYKNYIQNVFLLTEQSVGEESKEVVFKIEQQMAETMMEPAELRIPENTYNPVSRREAISKFKGLYLNQYFRFIEIESFDTLIVGQPEHFEYLNKLISSMEVEHLKTYMKWKVLNHYAPYLSEKLLAQHFEFYESALSGKSKMKPMNERSIEEMTDKAVKTALAREFVDRHFSAEAKDKVNDMVDNLLTVYRKRLENLEWMTAETKEEALKKLEAIGRKLGYPEEWKDISTIEIQPDNYVGNVDACAYYSFRDNIEKLNEPVDKKEWGMPAHMVNAYYHPMLNEIAFPAGIMQPPFFDINAEDAVNYGGIGMVIGHEFTHGFDDMGSKFAADGSFINWWSEKDRKNFEERTDKLGKTFKTFCPIDGHCVNPDLTMGENIADLGGITMAYHAYAMTDEFKKGEKRDGFTPAQRFFLSYAQLWKVNYTKEELKKRLATDPHSPGKYRVNGPLMNCPEFFSAFDVSEEDPMRNNASKISKIW